MSLLAEPSFTSGMTITSMLLHSSVLKSFNPVSPRVEVGLESILLSLGNFYCVLENKVLWASGSPTARREGRAYAPVGERDLPGRL